MNTNPPTKKEYSLVAALILIAIGTFCFGSGMAGIIQSQAYDKLDTALCLIGVFVSMGAWCFAIQLIVDRRNTFNHNYHKQVTYDESLPVNYRFDGVVDKGFTDYQTQRKALIDEYKELVEAEETYRDAGLELDPPGINRKQELFGILTNAELTRVHNELDIPPVGSVDAGWSSVAKKAGTCGIRRPVTADGDAGIDDLAEWNGVDFAGSNSDDWNKKGPTKSLSTDREALVNEYVDLVIGRNAKAAAGKNINSPTDPINLRIWDIVDSLDNVELDYANTLIDERESIQEKEEPTLDERATAPLHPKAEKIPAPWTSEQILKLQWIQKDFDNKIMCPQCDTALDVERWLLECPRCGYHVTSVLATLFDGAVAKEKKTIEELATHIVNVFNDDITPIYTWAQDVCADCHRINDEYDRNNSDGFGIFQSRTLARLKWLTEYLKENL